VSNWDSGIYLFVFQGRNPAASSINYVCTDGVASFILHPTTLSLINPQAKELSDDSGPDRAATVGIGAMILFFLLRHHQHNSRLQTGVRRTVEIRNRVRCRLSSWVYTVSYNVLMEFAVSRLNERHCSAMRQSPAGRTNDWANEVAKSYGSIQPTMSRSRR
jgi:hypothetical protein